jgi:hypothetical protein
MDNASNFGERKEYHRLHIRLSFSNEPFFYFRIEIIDRINIEKVAILVLARGTSLGIIIQTFMRRNPHNAGRVPSSIVVFEVRCVWNVPHQLPPVPAVLPQSLANAARPHRVENVLPPIAANIPVHPVLPVRLFRQILPVPEVLPR